MPSRSQAARIRTPRLTASPATPRLASSGVMSTPKVAQQHQQGRAHDQDISSPAKDLDKGDHWLPSRFAQMLHRMDKAQSSLAEELDDSQPQGCHRDDQCA